MRRSPGSRSKWPAMADRIVKKLLRAFPIRPRIEAPAVIGREFKEAPD